MSFELLCPRIGRTANFQGGFSSEKCGLYVGKYGSCKLKIFNAVTYLNNEAKKCDVIQNDNKFHFSYNFRDG